MEMILLSVGNQSKWRIIHLPNSQLQKCYSLSICTLFADFFITLCLTVMSYIPLRSILPALPTP